VVGDIQPLTERCYSDASFAISCPSPIKSSSREDANIAKRMISPVSTALPILRVLRGFARDGLPVVIHALTGAATKRRARGLFPILTMSLVPYDLNPSSFGRDSEKKRI